MCFAPKVSAPKVSAPAPEPEPIKDDPAPVSYGTPKKDEEEKSGTGSLTIAKDKKPASPSKPKGSAVSRRFGMNGSRK